MIIAEPCRAGFLEFSVNVGTDTGYTITSLHMHMYLFVYLGQFRTISWAFELRFFAV